MQHRSSSDNFFGEPLRCPQNIVIDHYKPILKKAKLRNLRLYDLRHSAATLLFAAGAPIKVVSEVLGHASVNLTQNTYIHVIPGMHQQAVRNMGEMLSAAGGKIDGTMWGGELPFLPGKAHDWVTGPPFTSRQ